MLKDKHENIWLKMGSPSIFSFKESLWSLLGLPNEVNVKQLLINENAEEKSISLLNWYRYSSYLEMFILLLFLIVIYVQ